jgi:hypothetical protein
MISGVHPEVFPGQAARRDCYTLTKPMWLLPTRSAWRVGLAVCVLALFSMTLRLTSQAQSGSVFASRIEQFSEPGGYFDTDNLISNEQSYLHPLDQLRQRGVSGGVYIGVGPDQNFSYIAQIRPSMAFIVDIRRDNMLLHLLFKAVFKVSRNRADYLSVLFGRPPPTGAGEWRTAGLRRLVQYFETAQPTPVFVAATRRRVDAAIAACGVPLSPADRETIDRFHRTFIESGLALRFQSTGRPPRSYYPTYRDLLLEKDLSGHEGHYLTSDESFQFVKSLQARDLVIPVVGNLAGDRALVGIGTFMTARGDRLSVFYVSNVEQYLSQDGVFARFIANLTKLPHGDRGVIIRSVFGRTTAQSVPGYYSTSLVQPIDQLLAGYDSGRFPTYWSLINPQ